MNTALNPTLKRDVSGILASAGKLHSFAQSLNQSGAALPTYLYLRPLQAEIVFTRPAIPRLVQLFGRDGWMREPSGTAFFDWVKTTEEGVKLRVSEAEEVPSPTSAVPPEMVAPTETKP